jgi:photosystem II stability/assembly factor-like uncharacterized protein
LKGKRKFFFSVLLISVFFVAVGCSKQTENSRISKQHKHAIPFQVVPVKNQSIGQIRGIGYPGNDNALYVATNDGIKMYRNSKWWETTADKHNYMSLQAIDTGFLASGHPQKGLGIKDPLGIIESSDQGKSFKKLAFYGQSNLHFLSSDYSGNDIYMINELSNNNLDQGLYYSNNSGTSWHKSKLANFTADSLGMIAVNSKNGNEMALSTKTGIFYSEDYGNTMKAISGPDMITALTFMGDQILYSSVVNQSILLQKTDPASGKTQNVVFPFLDYDNPITYITVDPKDENKIAFATYKNDLYVSIDGGKNWSALLAGGKIEQD